MRIVGNVRHAACALIVVLLAAVLAACGGGDRGSSGRAESAARNQTGADPAPGRDAQAPSIAKSPGGSSGGGSGGSAGSGGQPAVRVPPPAARAVVYTATLRVRTGDVDASAAKAKQLATAAGGYVENESGSSTPPSSTLTLKIPADRYAGLLGQLTPGLGTKLSLNQRAEDVTGEVADVDSRVRSAQATLTSFRKLLDRARTVGEVINVEQEIARREADLEALQARQKTLQQSTRYATLTVDLVASSKAAKKADDRGGFVGGLQDGWDAFTSFIGGAGTVLGWLLPFLVAAAAIGLPALAFRNRLRDRRPAPSRTAEREPVPVGARAEESAPERPEGQAPPR
ncbi:DUF4349 domain-containing protein [Actinomadura rubrisoli]|nr:DUF4349 domain-containing protein [Actinomadura rubrisoli]